MTRTGDVAPPAVTSPTLDPSSPLYRWPYRPVVALERLPQYADVWDDTDPAVVWDASYVWDAPSIGAGFTDAVCDFHTIDVDPGEPDELYLFPSVSCTVTLDNRTGRYTPWSADGRLVYWAPGRRLCIWLVAATGGEKVWLFSGRVASWVANADDTVTVVAWDGLSWLAQELGGTWTAGTAGDTMAARIAATATAAGYPDRIDVDAGNVTLAVIPDDVSPLEQIQRAALSDGGLFYGDADGSIDYRNRLWRAGRGDQTYTYTVSTNRCSAPVIVWDPEMAADDERLATDVRLTNLDALVATATLGAGSVWAGDARYRLSHPDPDLWQTQAQGNALAAYLLAQQSTPSMALERFALYGLDPSQPAVADMAARTRRGDRVEVLHDFTDPDGNPGTVDLFAIVLGVAHQLTPDEWVATCQLSRTVDYRVLELWDRTLYVWDQADPANVWRY